MFIERLLHCGVFAFQDAAVKWLVADHPVMQVLFMRSICEMSMS